MLRRHFLTSIGPLLFAREAIGAGRRCFGPLPWLPCQRQAIDGPVTIPTPPPPTNPTIVQAAYARGTGGTVTPTLGTGATTGNVLLAMLYGAQATNYIPLPPAGWGINTSGQNGVESVTAIYTKIAAGGETACAFAGITDVTNIAVYEVSNVAEVKVRCGKCGFTSPITVADIPPPLLPFPVTEYQVTLTAPQLYTDTVFEPQASGTLRLSMFGWGNLIGAVTTPGGWSALAPTSWNASASGSHAAAIFTMPATTEGQQTVVTATYLDMSIGLPMWQTVDFLGTPDGTGPPTIVQTANATSTSGTVTTTLGTTPTTGNKLVGIATGNAGSITTPSGFTLASSITEQGFQTNIYTAPATVGAAVSWAQSTGGTVRFFLMELASANAFTYLYLPTYSAGTPLQFAQIINETLAWLGLVTITWSGASTVTQAPTGWTLISPGGWQGNASDNVAVYTAPASYVGSPALIMSANVDATTRPMLTHTLVST
jgi:hypothetical protein